MSDNNIIQYAYTAAAENLQLKFLLEIHENTHKMVDPLVILTPHTHPYAEIFVCHKERILIHIPDGMQELAAGDVLIVPPNLPHGCLAGNNDAVWQALSFSCSRTSSCGETDLFALFLPCIVENEILYFPDHKDFCTCVQEILQMPAAGKSATTLMHMMYLLTGLMETRKQQIMKSAAEKMVGADDMIRLNRLDWFINNGFMLDLTAQEIADSLFLSVRQLSRIAKNRYGKTLHQVIIEKRLATAEQLLITTDHTIESIAAAVGFGSRYSFLREFQKRYTMTPVAYRMNRLK